MSEGACLALDILKRSRRGDKSSPALIWGHGNGAKKGSTLIHVIKVRFLYGQTNARLRSAVFHGFACALPICSKHLLCYQSNTSWTELTPLITLHTSREEFISSGCLALPSTKWRPMSGRINLHAKRVGGRYREWVSRSLEICWKTGDTRYQVSLTLDSKIPHRRESC